MKYLALDLETTGLQPFYGHRITCICARTEDNDTFEATDIDEAQLLMDFYSWLTHSTDEYFFLTKNGKMFDIPFLVARAAQLFVAEDFKSFMEAVLSYKHFDLQDIAWVKLEVMANLMGVKRLKEKENPITLWNNHQYKDLIFTCREDVRITIECYEKYTSFYPEKKDRF
jgi:uncharacterized protein YprB with RNaseH-like and TPR domain